MQCFCGKLMHSRKINKMDFYECPNCHYLKKANKLSSIDEKKRYDLHICDEGYRKYMSGVYLKIKPYLNEGISIDYGCGQIHLLADLMNLDNNICYYYDLYYYPNYERIKYDNIVLIEVFEHIDDIYSFLKEIKHDLNDNGRIIIMTKSLVDDLENWWYLRDETHISFVNYSTMNTLALMLKMKLIYDEKSSIFIFEA